MRYLAALIGLLIASCAPKAAVFAPLPSAPPKAVAVAPEVSKVREAIANADKQAATIRAAATEASRQITAARVDAERLAKAQAATPADLNGLWKALQSAESRNLFLEDETNRLSIRLTATSSDIARLEALASAKDAEASDLRRQNDDLRARVAASDKVAADAQAEAAKQRTRADKLAGEIRLYRLGLGIAALLLIAWVILKFILPPRPFG